jgi:hypothetical protein
MRARVSIGAVPTDLPRQLGSAGSDWSWRDGRAAAHPADGGAQPVPNYQCVAPEERGPQRREGEYRWQPRERRVERAEVMQRRSHQWESRRAGIRKQLQSAPAKLPVLVPCGISSAQLSQAHALHLVSRAYCLALTPASAASSIPSADIAIHIGSSRVGLLPVLLYSLPPSCTPSVRLCVCVWV